MYIVLVYSHDHARSRSRNAEEWSTIAIRNARRSDVFDMPDDAYDIHICVEDVEYACASREEAIAKFEEVSYVR